MRVSSTVLATWYIHDKWYNRINHTIELGTCMIGYTINAKPDKRSSQHIITGLGVLMNEKAY